ncbi:MAG TPA: HD domain-containing protein [Burkholderiales bacterium]|nr:HD domain-containing protein [Burkholderiales bacterium]
MQDRLNQNDVTNRINVEDPQRVRDAVLELFAARYPGEDLTPLMRAFGDFRALFEGRFPGYLACDTLYHDIRHSLDVTLAMARLIDGHERACAEPDRLGVRRAILGVLVALLHDAGYMKRLSESQVENGAVFTKTHVSRSADFVTAYLPQLGFGAEAQVAAQLVHFTGYEMEIHDIYVADPKDRLLGCMVGTADLIAQMSDRMYLEKCREFLYREFVLGNIARERLPDGREVVRYASGEDLIIKTPGFYEYVARDRIDKKLGAVDRYAEAHFGGPNLYQSEVSRNMEFLRQTIATADLNRLRRYCYSLSERVRRAA